MLITCVLVCEFRIKQHKREIGLELATIVLIYHVVPGAEYNQAHEGEQHADVQADVDFEAAVVATVLARLKRKRDLRSRIIRLTVSIAIKIVINRLLIE